MKKGQIFLGVVERVDFPNKGIVRLEGQYITNAEGQQILEELPSGMDEKSLYAVVKNTIPGQTVKLQVNKIRHKNAEGRLLEVVRKSDIEIEPVCPHFDKCGGCTYQNLPYDKQLELKEGQVRTILEKAVNPEDQVDGWFEGIKASPLTKEYRNKMEFTFGDEYKDGPLALGMHKRGGFYDIVTVDKCCLVHPDFREILTTTLELMKEENIPYFHRVRHEGYLRHLLVRRGVKSEEILIDLVTSTQTDKVADEGRLLDELVRRLRALESDKKLKGSIAGILHTRNDSLADVVQDDGTDILSGQNYFYEELLGLKFKITPFSFFQTNTFGAQVLYETAREYASNAIEGKPVIFDLYSGTGTIAQIMAPVAERVIGVEIVPEAVVAARENTELNGLHNCDFIAGDVLKVLDDLSDPKDKPDFIIVDPPRDGCHPKALPKIIDYGTDSMVYISCKVTSLARDLEMLQGRGYKVIRAVAIDQFPGTGHVETVVLMSKGAVRPVDERFARTGAEA